MRLVKLSIAIIEITLGYTSRLSIYKCHYVQAGLTIKLLEATLLMILLLTSTLGIAGYKMFRGGTQIAAVTSAQSAAVSATTQSAAPPPPPPTPPVSTPTSSGADFAARCAAAGVVRCFSFDTDADFNRGSGGTTGAYGQNFGILAPYGTSDYSLSTRDSSVSADGGSSLRFTIPANSGSDSSGTWFTNFSPDLATQFGANSDFYIQYRERFSPEMLKNLYAGSEGWKQDIIGTGDTPGMVQSSCSDLEVTMQNVNLRGYPMMYNSCSGSASHSAYDPFEEAYGASDFKLQNAMPTPYCLYSQNYSLGVPGNPPGGCFIYYPNEWMTFQIHIHTGPWVNGEFQRSHVDLWVAREGQPSQQVLNWGPYNLTADQVSATGQRFGKIWLLPYQTNKSASSTYPVAYVWYDDLIISTQKIADPAGSGSQPAITAQPSSQTIAYNGTANLSVTVFGSGLSYQWYRGTSGDTTKPVAGATSSSYITPALISNTRYWVRVTNSFGNADSNTATITVAFTDSPLVAGSTVIKAVHITELRARIDALRARYGVAAYSYSDPNVTPGVTVLRAVHINQMRQALQDVYDALGLPRPTYSTSPAAGVTTVVADISELRSAVLAIE